MPRFPLFHEIHEICVNSQDANLIFALFCGFSCHSLFAVTLGFVRRRSQWGDEFDVGNIMRYHGHFD